MSPAPPDASDSARTRGYNAAWAATLKLARAGSSWSGRERNCFFLNAGTGDGERGAAKVPRFVFASALSGADFEDDGRALALCDWDHDGDLDVWLRNRTAPRLRLLINNTRNGSDSRRNWVALSLEGTNCNRDAIGAQVSLRFPDGSVSKRSICAGQGFLSQSSKRLFFGLGRPLSPEDPELSVEVRWPGGSREAFQGVLPGGHYRLREGEGRASSIEPRDLAGSELRAGALDTSGGEVTIAAAVPLPAPIPLFEFDYESSEQGDGKEALALEKGDAPLLVVLFATWCPNCVRELKHLTETKTQLAKFGVEVLALSLDGADRDGRGSREGVPSVLAELGFPHRFGIAPPELPGRVEALHNSLFDNHPPFSIPFSMLLTPEREISAIYRGEIELSRVALDVAELRRNSGREELRSLVLPFAGRWFTKAATGPDVCELLGHQLRGSSPADAAFYLARAARDPDCPESKRGRLALDAATIHYELARDFAAKVPHERDLAVEHFEKAISLHGEWPEALHDYGALMANHGDLRKAEVLFAEAVRLKPDYALARRNLELVRSMLEK